MGKKKEQRTILDLGHEAAREFFLRHDSYTNVDLPKYFNFSKLLGKIDKFLQKKKFDFFDKAKKVEKVNHCMLFSKGRHDWRRIEFVHPVLYVGLVRTITEKESWEHICRRFKTFRNNGSVECTSIPVVRPRGSSKKQKGVTILNWWNQTEQHSVELALKYGCLLQTDIANCYDSIYTHSIEWAMHDKDKAKQGIDKGHIGTRIDKAIRNMRHGQTNGIPQGSALMDLIAEMVLGYADTWIDEKMGSKPVKGVKILRYRDDYRIFADNESQCGKVLKIITTVLMDMGMRINSSKTIASHDVIRSSVKADKLAWIEKPQKVLRSSSIKTSWSAQFKEYQAKASMQKWLFLIHGHAKQHPNSGSLLSALTIFHEELKAEKKWVPGVLPMISIATDIAIRNPKTYPHASAIISVLLERLQQDDPDAFTSVCEQIVKRFGEAPHSGHMEVWLHRIMRDYICPNLHERLTRLASLDGDVLSIWDNNWIDSSAKELKNLLEDSKLIATKAAYKKMSRTVGVNEVAAFRNIYS